MSGQIAASAHPSVGHPSRWRFVGSRPRAALPHWGYAAFEVSDVVAAYGALVAAFAALNFAAVSGNLTGFWEARIRVANLLALLLLGIVWRRTFGGLGLYHRSANGTRSELRRIALACSIAALPSLTFPLLSRSGAFTFRTAILFWAISIPAVAGGRTAIRWVACTFSDVQRRHLLIVGSGPRARALHRELSAAGGSGPKVVGFVDSNGEIADPDIAERLIGKLEDLERVLMRHVVDEVLIALPIKSCYREIEEAIHTCARVGVQSTYLSDIFTPSLGRVRYRHEERLPMRTVTVVQDDARLVVKRAADIVGSVVGLLVLSPALVMIAAAIKLTSAGPVFFAQERYGFNKRVFRMYKFRTMVENAEALQALLEDQNEAAGPVFKIARDPRVTPLGRFLRRTSLDELPQLVNVLRGEMSLAGPRPLATRDVGRFEEGWLMRRFSMRPGMTCLWQISGRSNLTFSDWVVLDLKYIDNWSLLLDWMIILKTLPAVIRGTGAQ